MHKLFLSLGAASGALSVGLGAFGAHALKRILTASGRLEVYETAVKYQFYHAFALLFLGVFLMIKSGDIKWFNYAGICFVIGTFIFSGSLYILSLSNVGKWGVVTPIGGLFLIAGWLCCFWGFIKMEGL